MVAPFLVPLKKWISQQLHADASAAPAVNRNSYNAQSHGAEDTEAITKDEAVRGPVAVEGQWNVSSRKDTTGSDTDRLLATLRSGQSHLGLAASTVESNAIAQENARVAELKRILSIGGQPSFQAFSQPEDNSKSNALLSMLKGRAPPTSLPPPPETPFEQLAAPLSRPRSPHQGHTRPAILSNLPPPPHFPIHPTHFGTQRPPQQPRVPPPQPEYTNFINLDHSHVQPAQPFHSQLPPQQSLRPYHSTDDPLAPPMPRFPNLHAPAISAVGPQPTKLTTHALDLLNTFRGIPKAGPSRSPVVPTQDDSRGHSIASASRAQGPIAQQLPMHMQSGFAPSNPRAFLSAEPPMRQTSLPIPSSQVGQQPTAPSQKSLHQNNLLNIFRAPSATSRTPLYDSAAESITPLENIPSKAEEDLAHAEAVAPRSSAVKEGTSRGIGPIPGPLYPPASRGPRQQLPIQNISNVNKTASRSMATPPAATPSTTTVHARQTTQSSRTRVTETSAPSTIAETEVKPLFQPHILQRPAGTERSRHQAQPSLDRRGTLPKDRKNALLSLFTKSGPDSPTSGIGSTSTSGRASPALGRTPTSYAADAGATKPPPTVAARSVASRSGVASPASPVDREVLLGYLEGVVKGGN